MSDQRVQFSKCVQDWVGAGLVLFFALYIIAACLGQEDRARLSGAGEAVGGFAVLAAAAAAVLALGQLGAQRQSIDDQRRVFELQQYAEIRREYARWLGAAHDLASAMHDKARASAPAKDWPDAFRDGPPLPEARKALRRAYRDLVKITVQVSLHDRSEVRRSIRNALLRALRLTTKPPGAVLGIVRDTRSLREQANKLDPVEPGKLGKVSVEMETILTTETDDGVSKLDHIQLLSVRNVAVHFAQLAVRASLAADEVAAGLTVAGKNLNDEPLEDSDDD